MLSSPIVLLIVLFIPIVFILVVLLAIIPSTGVAQSYADMRQSDVISVEVLFQGGEKVELGSFLNQCVREGSVEGLGLGYRVREDDAVYYADAECFIVDKVTGRGDPVVNIVVHGVLLGQDDSVIRRND